MLEWIKEILDFGFVSYYNPDPPRKKFAIYNIKGSYALILLKSIFPYFFIKKDVANIIIKSSILDKNVDDLIKSLR